MALTDPALATVLAPNCRFVDVESAWTAAGDGYDEELSVELVARDGCDALVLGLPGGAGLTVVRSLERRGDGIKVTLDPTRWTVGLPDPAGNRTATLALPDLLGGDRVLVEVRRRALPPWTTFAAPTAEAPRVSGAPAEARPTEAPEAAPLLARTRTLTLRVPGGNPQITLHPGGAADVLVEERVTVPPSDVPRVWLPEAPDGAAITLEAEPEGVATVERIGALTRVRIAPTEARTRLRARWIEPDPPLHGERGDLDDLALESVPDDVVFRREGERWSVARVGDRWILPDRDVLIRSLDRRFRAAALPEPGLPTELRGAPASEEVLAALAPTVAERAPVLPSGDPLFPRRLQAARKSGALTPLESALVIWLYADQLGFDADWALARPAPTETLPDEAPEPTSPAGYDTPLVVVRTAAGERWIDPSCGPCAPFELPPALDGARVLSPSGLVRTPLPTGTLRVEIAPDRVIWTASGPPALALRSALGDIPAEERPAALAAQVAGPGAALVSVEGLGIAGADVRVVATRGDGLVPDPTALPAPGPDGAVWVDWLGPRVVVRDGVEARFEPPARRFVPPPPPDPAPAPPEPPGPEVPGAGAPGPAEAPAPAAEP